MASNAAYSGEFKYQRSKFEFRITSLEFIRGKSLKIEAVCYERGALYPANKEHVFKYSVNCFDRGDEQLKISLSMINAIIKKAGLSKGKLYKLTIRNDNLYWIIRI